MAKKTHESLLGVLPVEEAEKHEIWFKAKIIPINEFIKRVNKRLPDTSQKCSDMGDINIDVVPEDSISNVSCATSKRSKHSSSKG